MDRKILDAVRQKVTINEFSTDDSPPSDFPLPQQYIDKMRSLGEKYKDIRWLPLDIPKIEFDDIEEFKSLWEKESIDVVRVFPDVAEPWSKEDHPHGMDSSWHVPSFRGLHLYNNEQVIPIGKNSFSGKLYTGNNKQLSRILEQTFDYFPMHTMISVFIWQSTREIIPHRDRGFFWRCPTEFRTMLYDENEDPTLYVADIEKGDAHYIDLPKDTNSFCWSNGTQVHGSDYYGKKKFILCVAGVQHTTRCDELFERSIVKYKDKLNYTLNYDPK